MEFYKSLIELGFKVIPFHEIETEDPYDAKYVCFTQTDTDGISFEDLYKNNKLTYLEWYVSGFKTKEDLDGWTSCLFCGGHYTNVYIFENGEDITSNYNFPHKDLDPDEPILDEEEIEELLDDMKLDED